MVTTPIKSILKMPGKLVDAISGHHPQQEQHAETSTAPEETPRKSGRIDKMLLRQLGKLNPFGGKS